MNPDSKTVPTAYQRRVIRLKTDKGMHPTNKNEDRNSRGKPPLPEGRKGHKERNCPEGVNGSQNDQQISREKFITNKKAIAMTTVMEKQRDIRINSVSFF
jgi:hypothetical protein